MLPSIRIEISVLATLPRNTTKTLSRIACLRLPLIYEVDIAKEAMCTCIRTRKTITSVSSISSILTM